MTPAHATEPAVEFLFDFGSPNAYLAHRVIRSVQRLGHIRYDYVPVLLGALFKATGNRSPMVAYADVPAKLAYERLEMERFVRRHGIAGFRMNPHFPINTLAAMRGAVAAGRVGVFEAYVDAVFRAMWEDGRKMDDPVVFRAALEDAGLPAAELLALSQDPQVKEELAANTARAVERGVFGSPTFVVGDELFFGKDRLREAEDAAWI